MMSALDRIAEQPSPSPSTQSPSLNESPETVPANSTSAGLAPTKAAASFDVKPRKTAPSSGPVSSPSPDRTADPDIVEKPPMNPATPPLKASASAPDPVLRPQPTSPSSVAATPTSSANTTSTPSAPTSSDPKPALAVSTIVLCQRVESFGRYVPLSSNSFLAGRPAAAIIYTEVTGFSSRPAEGASDQLVTELAQTIELWYDVDGTKQMVIPEQIVREVSRSRRQDFFLVQRLDLPATLSLGRYRVKVRVRDLTSGSESERSIPLNVLLDSSVIGRK